MDLSAATTETPFYGERRHFLTALRLDRGKKEQPITDRNPLVERHAFGLTRTENSSLSSVQHIIKIFIMLGCFLLRKCIVCLKYEKFCFYFTLLKLVFPHFEVVKFLPRTMSMLGSGS